MSYFQKQLFWPDISMFAAILLTIVFMLILRYRHVRMRKAERRCLHCQLKGREVYVERKHLRMRVPDSRSQFVSQTKRRCPTDGCVDNIWKEEKYGRPYFSMWRYIFHHSQFSDNARPEDFVGPLRNMLMKGQFNFPENPLSRKRYFPPPVFGKHPVEPVSLEPLLSDGVRSLRLQPPK